MASAIRQKAILFLDKTRGYFFGDNNEILYFDIPQNFITDLELLNKEDYLNLLTTWIAQNNISPSRMLIILSDSLLFSKDIAEESEEQKKLDSETFINNVPFTNVCNLSLKNESTLRLIATNCDIYEVVQTAFEEKGSIVEGVIPIDAVAIDPSTFSFTPESLKDILKKFDLIKQNSFTKQQEEVVLTIEAKENSLEANRKKRNLFILIPIFVLLVGILVYLIITQFFPQKRGSSTTNLLINPNRPVNLIISPSATPGPTAFPSLELSPTP